MCININNSNNDQYIELRKANENDLNQIFNLIQTVGQEMDSKDSKIFAYSKNPNTYLQMLKTGFCAVAVKNNKIIASLLTCPEDKDIIIKLANIPEQLASNTINFTTCQVLKDYRGNKLEQQLINFILYELNKLQNYKYAVCTVSPNNKASLKSVQNCGFQICNTAFLYGGKPRYILIKQLV